MSTLRVDPSHYEAASRVFGLDLALRVETVAKQLERKLAAASQMAGSDPTGEAWAGQYDPAAGNVVQALEDFRRASINVGGLLQQSGFNHARAEAHSDASGKTEPPPDITRYIPDGGLCVYVPSASGGVDSQPDAWTWIQQQCGAVWPNGDTGKLRSTASEWRTAAAALDDAVHLVTEGIRTIESQESPEIDDAIYVCRTLGDQLVAIAKESRVLATACDELAQHIDDAHAELLDQVAQFVALTAVIELAGALLAVETVGIGEVGAQVVEGFEVANVISRIAQIVREFDAAVKAVITRISVGALEGAAGALRLILQKIPTVADTTSVANGVKTLEQTAEDLSEASRFPAGRNPNYPDRWPDGTYAGRDQLALDNERLGLDQYAEQNQVEVIRQQVRAVVPGGRDSGRFYDGLVRIGDTNDYVAIEIKSGSAMQRYAGSDQAAFDRLVSLENPATAVLNGQSIRIVEVVPRGVDVMPMGME